MDREPKAGKPVTIYVTQGMLRANVIRGLLESAGIPVMLRYEAAGPAIGLVINGLGRVEVQVPAKYEQEACELLASEPAADEADAGDASEDTWDDDEEISDDAADAPDED